MKKRGRSLVEQLLLAIILLWIPFVAWVLYIPGSVEPSNIWSGIGPILFLIEFALTNLAGLISWGVLDKIFGTTESSYGIEAVGPESRAEKSYREKLSALTLLMYGLLTGMYVSTMNVLHLSVGLVWIANASIVLSFVILGLRLTRRQRLRDQQEGT
ncbi:MAG TPA: hypothetical protein VF992_11220 [Thermoplasmata archaeon]